MKILINDSNMLQKQSAKVVNNNIFNSSALD